MFWNRNRKIRLWIGLAAVVLTVFWSFAFPLRSRSVPPQREDRFSAVRVAEDLEVISREPHSIEHPQARDRVRRYLAERLAGLGADTAVYHYTQVPNKFGGTMDIADVYGVLEPAGGAAPSYVLFVAHLDSRFRQEVRGEYVYSFGAADDGYGLGVILELVRDALRYRSAWKQGIKVLFTDAEEHELDGMRCAVECNPELLDRVGLVVNVEARGVKGPALLFETSPRNAALASLYHQEAVRPHTYSLTSAVYRIMPNYTDFSLVKDRIPGLNFSVLDNVHYYHTDRDNFSNISLPSIQHYGDQLEPLLERYLTDSVFSDPDALRSEDDAVFFTVPGAGMFRMTVAENRIFALVTAFLFCVALAFHTLTRNVRLTQVLRKAAVLLGAGLLIAAAGEGAAWLSARLAGTPFGWTATKFVPWDTAMSVAFVLLIAAGVVLALIRGGRRDVRYFVNETLFAALALQLAGGLAMTFALGENFFLLVPVALGSLALIFCFFLLLNLLALPALLGILLLQCAFLYDLLTALTVGSLGLVLLLAFLNLVTVAGLFENFIRVKIQEK